MDSTSNEQLPYLSSDETGGHNPIAEEEYTLLGNLSLAMDGKNPVSTIDQTVANTYKLLPKELELLSHLQMSKYLEDGNLKADFPLSTEDVIKVAELLKKVELSDKELEMVLQQKISLHDTVALHTLQTFGQRLKENKADEEDTKKREGSKWQITSGNYGVEGGFATRVVSEGDDDFLWEVVRNVPEGMKVEDLLGEELTMADIIRQSLDLGGDRKAPLMIVDIGGLAGLSWHRLAYHFRDEVANGKLAFIVTSLGVDFEEAMRTNNDDYQSGQFSPDTANDEYGDSHSRGEITNDELRFILKTKDLVHHVQADLPTLFNMNVKVNAENFPVLGNVALANDNNAVALHSLIPSVHIPLIVSLLSESGVYKSNVISTFYAPKTDHFRARDAELSRSYIIAINECGMEFVAQAEDGSSDLVSGNNLKHVFLRKPHGPKIRAFLLPEQIENAKQSITQ